MKKLAALAAITAILSVDLAGCATASDVDDGIVPGRRGDAGSGDADDEDAGDEDTGSAKDSSTTGTDAKADVKTDAPSTTDVKTDAPSTTDAKTDTGGTTCPPATASDCQSAEHIGNVSGDSNADVVSKSGTGNSFVQATVTEDNSELLNPKDLRVTITLKSTGGANYDLFAYLGDRKGDSGGVECSTISGQSNASGDETVILTWEDKQSFPAGKSDERILSLEIRSATGTCSGGWDLTVEGNK